MAPLAAAKRRKNLATPAGRGSNTKTLWSRRAAKESFAAPQLIGFVNVGPRAPPVATFLRRYAAKTDCVPKVAAGSMNSSPRQGP